MISRSNISVLDHYRFRERGAIYAGSHYVLKGFTCCGRQCVEDEELGLLHVDPTDLSKTLSLLVDTSNETIACPFCGSSEWDLNAIEDLASIGPEWKWAAIER